MSVQPYRLREHTAYAWLDRGAQAQPRACTLDVAANGESDTPRGFLKPQRRSVKAKKHPARARAGVRPRA